MPIPDNTIPLATMDEVQEKTGGPTTNHAAVGRDLLAMLMLCGEPEVRATAHLPPQQQLRALIDTLIDHRRLFTRLSDFMRRCDPARLKPREEQASDDEWKAMEAEVNAAIGGATVKQPVRDAGMEIATLSQAIIDIAAELGCEPDNEATLQRIVAMKSALGRIERWFDEFPPTGLFWDKAGKEPMSYAAAYGSNGERDYMRGVARDGLTGAIVRSELDHG